MKTREEPVPFNPDDHPLRVEALAAWEDKYGRQSILSNPPPSAFKRFFQGYTAGHDALTAQLAALRAERDEANRQLAQLGEWSEGLVDRVKELTKERDEAVALLGEAAWYVVALDRDSDEMDRKTRDLASRIDAIVARRKA